MTNALTVKNLKKTYRNGTKALNGIDLNVAKGDFFALLGSNGAGKSTAIGIISSLVNATSGDVEIFDFNLNKEPSKAKRLIGLVPQEFNFNQWEPVGEIVVNQAGFYGVNRQAAWKRAEITLRQMELWDQKDLIARALSGGMKRRLMIARALVHQPQLLILDEPTAGVDIEIRQSMWKFIEEINQAGTTIILTTHYLEEAESLCRNIAIIDKGLIVEDTSMASLLSQLDKESYLLDINQPLKTLPELKQYNIKQRNDRRLEVTLKKGDSLNALFEQLTKENIMVNSMRTSKNRLEQLFMSLKEAKNNE